MTYYDMIKYNNEKLFSTISKPHFAKNVDRHTKGKWLIFGIKH